MFAFADGLTAAEAGGLITAHEQRVEPSQVRPSTD
jgi:hypothetical protein